MEDKLRTISCGGREISWVLTRKSVKNVNLRIKPDGIVRISASRRVPIGFIEDFICRKSDFIFASMDKFAAKAAAPDLPAEDSRYESGDTVCFLGSNYTLSIKITPYESAAVDGNRIILSCKTADRAAELLKKFYSEETFKLFEELNKRTCAAFRAKGYLVPQARVQIRKMRSRWGSCHVGKDKIVMNSRLALYPEECSAYVFAHEYAHFAVPNHSAEFYAVLADIMPDYAVYVKMLAE